VTNQIGANLALDSHADFDFDYNSTFSFSAWIKTTDADAHDAIISKTGVDDSFRGWSFKLTYGKPTFNLKSGDFSQILVSSATTVNDGDWHHFAATYDGSTDASGTAIYVDGVSMSLTVTYDNLGNDDTTNTYDVTIAARDPNSIDGWGKDWYDGNIDEVSVWDKELTSAEVTEMYNSGAPDSLTGHSAASDLLAWWRMGDGDNGSGTDDSSDSSDSNARIYDMSENSHNMTPEDTECVGWGCGEIVEDVPE